MAKFIFAFAILMLIFSCSNKKQTVPPALPDGVYCFEYNLSFDTIRASMEIKNAVVSGTMRYIFYEKDNSAGTLNGKIEGDRIFAVYKAESSGGQLETEILFLVQDGELNVGFGEMEDKNGVMVYKDTSALNYDTFALRPSDCK